MYLYGETFFGQRADDDLQRFELTNDPVLEKTTQTNTNSSFDHFWTHSVGDLISTTIDFKSKIREILCVVLNLNFKQLGTLLLLIWSFCAHNGWMDGWQIDFLTNNNSNNMSKI